MSILSPLGMDTNGQERIARSGDKYLGLEHVDNTSDADKPVSTAQQSALDGKVPASRTVNGHALSSDVTVTKSDLGLGNLDNTSDLSKPISTAIQAALNGKEPSIPTGTSAQYIKGDKTLGTMVSTIRTTSSLSLSLVGTGATGTQISSTKDSTVRVNLSTSTTSTIGGPSTSLVTLKKCATNNATEGSWTTVAVFENDQTLSVALAINSIQIIKGQLSCDLPAGWYVKLLNSGTGTHTEGFISGEQTIYG